jgi:hypothetical protein
MNLYPIPAELNCLLDKPVWGLFTRNKIGRKYTIPIIKGNKACSSNNEDTLLTFNEVLEIKKEDQYVVLSIILANNYLPLKLNLLDIDGEKDDFNPYYLQKFLNTPDTYAEFSPSGRGYHLFYFTDKDKKLDKIDQKGYDTADRGFVTFTFHPISQRPILKVQGIEYQATGSADPLPLKHGDKISPIYCYNMQNSIEDILKEHGYIQKGKKFLYPQSTSGVPGVFINKSWKGDWNTCYSFHQDDPLHNKIFDPFELQVLLKYDGNKKKALYEVSKTIQAIDGETGEILDKTVDEYNNPPSDLQSFLDEETHQGYPEFNEDIFMQWPEPWPLLFKTYKSLIYNYVPVIAMPSCASWHGVGLFNKFKTHWGRPVNTANIIGSRSGGGKDVNTAEVMDSIITLLGQEWGLQNLELDRFLDAINPVNVSNSSGTNYLQTIAGEGREGGCFYLDTEASSHFRNMVNSKNSNVDNILSVDIAAYNGKSLPGRVTQNTNLDPIKNPNVTTLRLLQTGMLGEAFNESMSTRGYFPRLSIFLDLEERKTACSTGYTDETDVSGNHLPNEYVEFMKFVATYVTNPNAPVIRIYSGKKDSVLDKYNRLLIKYRDENKAFSDDEWATLERVAGYFEKQVTLVTAYNYLWRLYKKLPVNDLVKNILDGEVEALDGGQFEQNLVPLINYYVKVKRCMFREHFVETTVSKQDKALDKIWEKLLKSKAANVAPWRKKGGIPITVINNRLQQDRAFKQYHDDSIKINRILVNWSHIRGLKVLMVTAATGKKRNCFCFK